MYDTARFWPYCFVFNGRVKVGSIFCQHHVQFFNVYNQQFIRPLGEWMTTELLSKKCYLFSSPITAMHAVAYPTT